MKRWEDFQKEFSTALTRPLDSSSGSLQAVPHPLAAYNRQYWIRMYTTMQNEYPLVTKIVGPWKLNLLTQTFLEQHPPRTYDLVDIADPFIPWLRAEKMEEMILEAATLDHLRQEVLLAPDQEPWQLTAEMASQLGQIQLKPSPCWGIFAEHWDLVTWSGQGRPAPRPKPQHWLIRRQNLQMMHEKLSAPQAAFYEMLRESPIGAVLAALPDLGPENDRPVAIETWMRQGMEWGLWAL